MTSKVPYKEDLKDPGIPWRLMVPSASKISNVCRSLDIDNSEFDRLSLPASILGESDQCVGRVLIGHVDALSSLLRQCAHKRSYCSFTAKRAEIFR